MQTKPTLQLHTGSGQSIAPVAFYGNSSGNRLPFEACAGALRTLAYRKRYHTAVTDVGRRLCAWRIRRRSTSPSDIQVCSHNRGRAQIMLQALGLADSEGVSDHAVTCFVNFMS